MSSYGLWQSAAGMKIQEYRQTIHANNMANANTTGFKQDLAVITQREVESRASSGGFRFSHDILDGMGGGLNVRPTYRNFAQGPIVATGKALDVAIEGKGFFAVSDNNVTRYTRDGRFAINSEGDLVLTVGEGRWKILDDGGAPISIDLDAGAISIRPDGTLRQGPDVVARLGLAAPEDLQTLRKVGENLFDADGAEMTPVEGRFVPRAREESNVNVMRGLVSMVEAARAYQLNAQMVRLQDEMTARAVSTVGRAS